MTAPVCFVDTETTGLDPDRHAIWEVGLITPDGKERVWQFPVVELDADPFALDVGHWWERRWSTENDVSPLDALYCADSDKSRRTRFPDEGRAIVPGRDWCVLFRQLTAGLHLVGAVVSFDEERLRRLLRSQGVLPRWHYHLVDVEALAAGYIASGVTNAATDSLPPWSSTDLSLAVGVDPKDFDRHTALGDARWAKAIYEAVLGGES